VPVRVPAVPAEVRSQLGCADALVWGPSLVSWLLRIEEIHKGSILINDSVLLTSAPGTGLSSPAGISFVVHHLVPMPPEELVLVLDDEFAGHPF